MPNMMTEPIPAARSLVVAMALGLVALATVPTLAAAGDQDEESKPRVLILPTQWQEGVSEVVPSKVDEYLKQLLDISGQADFFTLDNLQPPPVEEKVEIPEEDPVLKKADNLLWDAKEEVGKGKYYRAAAAFKKAMQAYESRFDVLVDFDKYIDASLGVALSYFYAKQSYEGERALKAVLSHRPDLILDKRKVPKEALVEMIVQRHAMHGQTIAGTMEGELRSLRQSELEVQAQTEGVAARALEAAIDDRNPKDAIIRLLLERRPDHFFHFQSLYRKM